MHLSIFKKLRIGEARPTTVMLQLAHRSYTQPDEKIEDMLMQVGKFIFLMDFVLLDCEVDMKVPIVFRGPFLATRIALINVQKGQLTMRANH